jgi:hypothetical protein
MFLVDGVLLYTYFAITEANFAEELEDMLFKTNWFFVPILNAVQSYCLILFIERESFIFLFLFMLINLCYIVPSVFLFLLGVGRRK